MRGITALAAGDFEISELRVKPGLQHPIGDTFKPLTVRHADRRRLDIRAWEILLAWFCYSGLGGRRGWKAAGRRAAKSTRQERRN